MYLDFISDLNVKSNQEILDFGCGNGSYVKELRDAGMQAFGSDVEFKDGAFIAKLVEQNIVKKIGLATTSRKDVTIESEDYIWPWEDKKFDFVCSRAVIEHISNIDQFLAENYRVIKPDGVSLHYFPSRYSIVEPHVGIPFGGVWQSRWYYKIMCSIGLCRKKYRNNGELAFRYMKESCFYMSDVSLVNKCEQAGFQIISFGSKKIIKYYKNGRYSFLRRIIIFSWVIFKFRSRIILLKRSK